MTNFAASAKRFWSQDRNFVTIALSIFVLVLLVGVLRHEMWRDELQAWCIARDSLSLPEVHDHLLYEGHPILWYLPLFILTRFTHNPLSMQLLNVMLMSAACFIVLKFAPFSRLQKVLFCFGYFPLFEYGVISRSYSMELLLIVLFCWIFKERHNKLWIVFLILTLLASVNAYGLMLALAFTATLIFECLISRAENYSKIILAAGTALVVGASALTLIQMSAPADGYHGEPSAMLEKDPHRLFKSFMAIPVSYAPIPNPTTPNFWNTNIISQLQNQTLIELVCAVVVLISGFLLCTRPTALFLYLLGTGGLVVFSYTHMLGGMRQQGHFFLVLLSSLWIAYYVPDKLWSPLAMRLSNDLMRSRFLTIILALQTISGLYAYIQDLVRPFSAARQTANYIKANNLADTMIVGSNDHPMTAVSGYLDKPIFYPESQTYSSFVVNNTSRQNVSFDELFKRSKKAMEIKKVDNAILILNYPLGAIPQGFKVSGLNQFDKSIQPDERFYLYRIFLDSQPKSPKP